MSVPPFLLSAAFVVMASASIVIAASNMRDGNRAIGWAYLVHANLGFLLSGLWLAAALSDAGAR